MTTKPGASEAQPRGSSTKGSSALQGRDKLRVRIRLARPAPHFWTGVHTHTIMLALEGLPAIYLHSMLGTENDHEGVARTGRARTINRHQWPAEELEAALADDEGPHRALFDEMKRRIRIRRAQKAFHPNATQYTLHFNDQVFAFWRESLDRDQSVFAIHNVSPEPQSIPLVELNLIATEQWTDLIGGARFDDFEGTIELEPYGCVWITNKI